MSTSQTTSVANIAQRVLEGFYEYNLATKALGWPEDSNNWMHLLSITHTNPDGYWALQLAGGFWDNDRFYIRKTIDNGSQPWRELYHSGNLFRSLLEFIPASLHGQIKASSYTGDVSPFVQAALDSGADLYVPAGRYPLKSGVRQTIAGQKVFGTTHGRSVFDVTMDGAFNRNAPWMFRMTHLCELRDVMFDCAQPMGDPNQPGGGLALSQINQYPWLIHIGGASRVRIDNVQMAKGWNGIYAHASDGANPGGSNLSRIEDGCLNCGLSVDGALDFFTVESWESWVYGFPGTGLQNWSYANPGYVEFKSVDGLSVNSMNMWKKRVVTDLGATQLAGSLAHLKLDGGDAHFEHRSGDVAIGTMNCLTDSQRSPAVLVTGGRLTIGSAHLKQAAAMNGQAMPGLIEVYGVDTHVQLNGGTIISHSTEPEIRVHAGSLQTANVYFDGRQYGKPNGQAYTDGGRLFLSHCHFQDSDIDGFAVRLNNNEHHQINHNFMGARRIRRPAALIGSWTGNTGVKSEEVF